MSKWFIENKMGFDAPFLQQSLEHRPCTLLKNIPESECSGFTITGLSVPTSNLVMRGYIDSKGRIVPINTALGNEIITFSCFDEIFVYFHIFNEKEVQLYELRFFCCANWKMTELKAYRKGLFGHEEFVETSSDYITVNCSIKNYKSAGQYHYNLSQPIYEEKRYTQFTFQDSVYTMQKYQCVFCLRMFKDQNRFINHINFTHTYYLCEVVEGNIKISKAIDSTTPKMCSVRKLSELSQSFIAASSKNHIAFFKKRDRIRYEYPLKNHTLLIEREYEGLSFVSSLARHANSRELLHEGENTAVMREWNALRIESEDIKLNIKKLLIKMGITDSTLRLCELFYKNGFINSNEIMGVLNELEILAGK